MKILIATGIYPPDIGGPAQYAKNLYETWSKDHSVTVKTYGLEHKLPTGIRHIYYFFKILPSVITADFVFSLDHFSVGLPAAVACRIFNIPIIIRIGGDFLWESHVERTKEKILLRDFYRNPNLNLKEKIIFNLTKFTLKKSKIIFSTTWQRDIWQKPYDIRESFIVENFYGPKIPSEVKNKMFLGSTRPLVWKNLDNLPPEVFTKAMPYEEMMKNISDCYAVILVSLGDVSPNMILDAIARNKPFILTKENGLDRIKDIALLVDPLDKVDINNKINWLKDHYEEQKKKVENFNFTHTWQQIADEIIIHIK